MPSVADKRVAGAAGLVVLCHIGRVYVSNASANRHHFGLSVKNPRLLSLIKGGALLEITPLLLLLKTTSNVALHYG